MKLGGGILHFCKIRSFKNEDVIRFIFNKLVRVYSLQFIMVVFDVCIYMGKGYRYFDMALLLITSNLFFTLIYIVLTYSFVCMRVAVDEELVSHLILLGLSKGRFQKYNYGLYVINFAVGSVLLMIGESYVGGLGFSWFVTYVFFLLIIQVEVSQYKT